MPKITMPPAWLMFNDAGGDNGGSGGTGTTSSTATAGDDTGKKAGTPDQTKPDSGGDEAKFTQADLDRAIEKRLARERKQLDGLDLDALKEKAAKFDKAEADKLPELDRLTRERDDAKARAETAEAKLADLEKAEELRATVADVAKAKEVPAELLRGTTKEELEAHAEALKAAGLGTATKKPAPRSSAFGRTNGTPARPATALRGMGTLRAAYENPTT